MKSLARLAAIIALLGHGPAEAEQYAFVASFEERQIQTLDLETGAIVNDWRTNGSPRDMIRVGDFLVLATENEATLHSVFAGGRNRIDLKFDAAGIISEGVAVDADATLLFVLQRSASNGSLLVKADLGHPRVADCLINLIKDCTLPADASSLHSLPFGAPRFVAYSPSSGTVFAVDTAGAIAEFDPATDQASLVSLGNHPAPSDPRGMAVSPDGEIAISGYDGSDAIVTLLQPGGQRRLETIPLPLTSPGGVAFDPRPRPFGFEIVVSDLASNSIVTLRNSSPKPPASLGPFGSNAVDMAMDQRGRLATANQNGTATLRRDGQSQQVSVHASPVAVVIGEPFNDPEVGADPYELGWTYRDEDVYRSLGSHRIVLRNIGDGQLAISDLAVVGFDTANFALVNETCTGNALDAGDSCVADVDFRPGAYTGRRLVDHTYQARLRVVSNTADLELPLVGEHALTGRRGEAEGGTGSGFRYRLRGAD